MNRICMNCLKRFHICRSRLEEKPGRGKFCSRECTDTYKKEHQLAKDENNPAWKGDDVSYSGIHRWLRNNFEKTDGCIRCGKSTGFKDNRSGTVWALKKDRDYSRDRDDYLELCVKCHSLYDWGRWTDDKGEKHPMTRVAEIGIVEI